MGHRLSKIYTRKGDAGETGLGDNTRVSKDHLRVEAYGTIDELNSIIGLILTSQNLPPKISNSLLTIQHKLFEIGSELCIPGYDVITENDAKNLEKILDEFNAELPPLKEFILPGGSPTSAQCHIARTICRRAERRVVSLMYKETINPATVAYLNRLSDLLFVFARVIVRIEGGQEVLWQREH